MEMGADVKGGLCTDSMGIPRPYASKIDMSPESLSVSELKTEAWPSMLMGMGIGMGMGMGMVRTED